MSTDTFMLNMIDKLSHSKTVSNEEIMNGILLLLLEIRNKSTEINQTENKQPKFDTKTLAESFYNDYCNKSRIEIMHRSKEIQSMIGYEKFVEVAVWVLSKNTANSARVASYMMDQAVLSK